MKDINSECEKNMHNVKNGEWGENKEKSCIMHRFSLPYTNVWRIEENQWLHFTPFHHNHAYTWINKLFKKNSAPTFLTFLTLDSLSMLRGSSIVPNSNGISPQQKHLCPRKKLKTWLCTIAHLADRQAKAVNELRAAPGRRGDGRQKNLLNDSP